jgi:dihydropteroate synthase
MPKLKAMTDLKLANNEQVVWGKRTYIMGIINVTPDSFSGDGLGSDLPAIVRQAQRFEAEGADILDVGAESSRPGSAPIGAEEEMARLIPAIEAILPRVSLPICIDTYKAKVAQRALSSGARIINDIWGLKSEPTLASVVADFGAPIILMHNQKTTEYRDLLSDVLASLKKSVKLARTYGVPVNNIILDPGIGFGKTPDHNLQILKQLTEIKTLGFPILIGTSRKSTIGRVLDLPTSQRLEGTAATVTLSIVGGADIIRVHDVKQMVRVAQMTDAVVRDWRPPDWKP